MMVVIATIIVQKVPKNNHLLLKDDILKFQIDFFSAFDVELAIGLDDPELESENYEKLIAIISNECKNNPELEFLTRITLNTFEMLCDSTPSDVLIILMSFAELILKIKETPCLNNQ